MPFDEYLKCSACGKSAFRVTIYLRDTFKWTMEERTKAYFWQWTADDTNKLGGNIVTYIRFSGNSDLCGSANVSP